MRIDLACSSPGEATVLHQAIADFSHDGPRARYVAWLSAIGDDARARTVRASIDAFQDLDRRHLRELAGTPSWHRMIGIPLLTAFIEGVSQRDNGNSKALRDRIFGYLRPALSLDYRIADQEFELGSSYLWGTPDLPEGATWPRVAELSDWFNARDALPAALGDGENACRPPDESADCR